jgi:hypothetical protein
MGEFDNLLAPAEVVNGLNSEGELSGFNQLHATCSGGNGFGAIRAKNKCVTFAAGNDGSGFFTSCDAVGEWGNGTKPPTGERGTAFFASGTAKTGRNSITRMCNADGTGVNLVSGGSGKPTILVSTGDGQNGMLITSGFVALYSMGTELILHGYAGKITSTYHLIQETNKGAGQMTVRTHSA